MGIFNIFKKQKSDYNGRNFTEEERKLAQEIRGKNAEFRRLEAETEHQIKMKELELRKLQKQKQIEDLRAEIYGEEEEEEEDTNSADSIFQNMIIPLFSQNNKKQTDTSLNPLSQNTTPEKVVLTSEQIEDLFKSYKKYVPFLKKLTDEQLKIEARNRFPTLSDESISALVARVRR